MEIIANANETVLQVLKKFNKKSIRSRLFQYCAEAAVEEGVLLFNILTKEEVLLSHEEYAHINELEYLKDHWFIVPEDCKDKEYADFAKWYLNSRQKKDGAITGYTIFTTTDCNARCFYCFELGRSRIPMSDDTALKTVEYIKEHCKGYPVQISWFGGEPLFNAGVIDIICDGLRDAGIRFKSNMVTNGYLFDEATAKKAAEKWNVTNVQISLDGTEAVYNKAKAFIYKGENAYQIVLQNMGYVLDAGIAISVRLNMDLYNAEDLLNLVDELATRFGGRKGISIYAHYLFKDGVPLSELYTEEEWNERDAAMRRLEDRIRQNGMQQKSGISKKIRFNQCMADSGKAVTILPDGNIGLCENFSETEFIGHIDREGFDEAVIKSWKERKPEEPECAECVYYPACIQINKCPNKGKCYPLYRVEKKRKILRSMINEYENWKNKEEVAEEDAEDC